MPVLSPFRLSLASLLIVAALLPGCADNGPAGSRGTVATVSPPPKPEPSMSPSKSGNPAAGVELPQSLLAPAIADLANRVGAEPADIRVLRAIPVTWNDGAVGCPEPGLAYTQALVPGYWAVLEYAGKTYSYHAGSGARLRLCEGAGVNPAGEPPHGRYNDET